MVYSIFYYATEAITRAVVGAIIKFYEWWETRKARHIEEKKKEKKVPRWGFFTTTTPYGSKEYVYIGRHTKLMVSIPDLIGLNINAHPSPPPVRLYFTFAEAASKDWFKEIEWLAQQAEKMASEKAS